MIGETIAHPTVPDELPQWSVVLDRYERAWQLGERLWCRAGAVLPLMGVPNVDVACAWRTLLHEFGPVTVVHVGDAR